jgi:hypothetical protein
MALWEVNAVSENANRKLSSSRNLAKDSVCLPALLQAQSDAYEALWSPSCDSTSSPLTSVRAACTGGAEKFGSPAIKTFFDSIGHFRRSEGRAGRFRSTQWAETSARVRLFGLGPRAEDPEPRLDRDESPEIIHSQVLAAIVAANY